MMTENDIYVSKIMKRALLVIGLGSLVLLVFSNNKLPHILGLLLGGFLALIFLKIIYLNVTRAIEMSEKGARKFMLINYFMRMSIAGAILFISSQSEYLNIFTCFFGLLSVKIGMYLGNIIDIMKSRKERRKNGL